MPIIISTNTTISGLTQYTDDVQVAPGVTLTIPAGGVLDLGGYELLNYGTLTLAGSSSAFATMRSGKYSTDSTSGTLNSNFGRLEGVVVDGFFSDGSLNLLIQPCEVLSRVANVTILEVANNALRVLLQHRHVIIGSLA